MGEIPHEVSKQASCDYSGYEGADESSKSGGLKLAIRRHGEQLMKSAHDAVYYNAKARILKALQNDEITREQAEKLLEKLEQAKGT